MVEVASLKSLSEATEPMGADQLSDGQDHIGGVNLSLMTAQYLKADFPFTRFDELLKWLGLNSNPKSGFKYLMS